MTYHELLEKIIDEGIAAVRRDYPGDAPRRVAKRAGSIEGFAACRGKLPQEIADLMVEADKLTSAARIHPCTEEQLDWYWHQRCRELEIEWVANCVSVVLVNQGGKCIIPPTARAALFVARIVGTTS